MPKNNFVTELVNAFNLFNYYFDNFNTNFTVKGNKIVGLFASDVEVKKYFQEVKKEIIKQHYGTEEAAGKYYNLNYFPFVFDANSQWKAKERAIREVELADSTNNEVIRNLKIYFAKEFQRVVEGKVIQNLKTSAGMTEKKACECLEGSVLEGIDRYSPYLYCISFNDRYFKESRYSPRFFEVFRGMYISVFDLKLELYGFNDSSIFYEQRGNKLYIKDITNINVVKNIAKHVREGIALHFKTPDKEDSKVENFKDVLSSLMPKRVRKSISAYDYDIFTDEKKIQNGDSFVLIPLIEMDDGRFETLSSRDASKINGVFNNFISDIKGKTANPQYANCKEPVYAFSNKQIALLLPKIMESPIAYNQISGRFEFAVDLENFKRRGSSRSSSTVASPFNSPTHAEPSGLRTPPKQRQEDRDSGIGVSPPRPEGSSDDPGSFLEQSQAQGSPTWGHGEELGRPPRRGLEEVHMLLGTRGVPGTSKGFSPQNVPAGFNLRPQSRPSSWKGANESGSAWTSQPIGYWSSPAPSAEPSLWQPSRPLSRKGANESGSAWTSQPIDSWPLPASSAELRQQSQVSSSGPSSSRGADESVRTEKSIWYVPSSYSPGVEDVNDVEPEKQQVSDGCSEAKSQKSKSPKERGGGVQKIKKLFSSPFKKQYDVSLKRHDVGRDTTRSMPTISVTEKPPVPKPFFSFPTRIKAKSNPPSGVASPTHEGAPGGLKPLTSDERKELRPLLSPEQQRKLDSNSFLPGEEQHLYLTHTPSGKREIKNSFENPEENLRRSVKAQLPGDRSSQASADSGLGKSLERGRSPSLIEKFGDECLINSRVDSPDIKEHLQKEKEFFA